MFIPNMAVGIPRELASNKPSSQLVSEAGEAAAGLVGGMVRPLAGTAVNWRRAWEEGPIAQLLSFAMVDSLVARIKPAFGGVAARAGAGAAADASLLRASLAEGGIDATWERAKVHLREEVRRGIAATARQLTERPTSFIPSILSVGDVISTLLDYGTKGRSGFNFSRWLLTEPATRLPKTVVARMREAVGALRKEEWRINELLGATARDRRPTASRIMKGDAPEYSIGLDDLDAAGRPPLALLPERADSLRGERTQFVAEAAPPLARTEAGLEPQRVTTPETAEVLHPQGRRVGDNELPVDVEVGETVLAPAGLVGPPRAAASRATDVIAERIATLVRDGRVDASIARSLTSNKLPLDASTVKAIREANGIPDLNSKDYAAWKVRTDPRRPVETPAGVSRTLPPVADPLEARRAGDRAFELEDRGIEEARAAEQAGIVEEGTTAGLVAESEAAHWRAEALAAEDAAAFRDPRYIVGPRSAAPPGRTPPPESTAPWTPPESNLAARRAAFDRLRERMVGKHGERDPMLPPEMEGQELVPDGELPSFGIDEIPFEADPVRRQALGGQTQVDPRTPAHTTGGTPKERQPPRRVSGVTYDEAGGKYVVDPDVRLVFGDAHPRVTSFEQAAAVMNEYGPKGLADQAASIRAEAKDFGRDYLTPKDAAAAAPGEKMIADGEAAIAAAESKLARLKERRESVAAMPHGPERRANSEAWKRNVDAAKKELREAKKLKADGESFVEPYRSAPFFDDVESTLQRWWPQHYNLTRRLRKRLEREGRLDKAGFDETLLDTQKRTQRLNENTLRRRGTPYEERLRDYGMQEDLATEALAGLAEARHALEQHKLYRDIASGKVRDDAGRSLMREPHAHDAVQMPDEAAYRKTGGSSRSRTFGDLAGKWVQEDVARELIETQRAAAGMRGWMPTALRLWKAGKTVFHMGTMARNVYTNAIVFAPMMGMSLLNPRNWKYYTQALKDFSVPRRMKSQWFKEAFEDGLFESSFAKSEVASPVVVEHLGGIFGNPANALQRIIEQPRAIDKLVTTGKMVKDLAGELYGAGDDVFRLATYIKDRKRGLSREEARDRNINGYLDYNATSGLIQWLRTPTIHPKHPLASAGAFLYAGQPFISFPAKAVPLVTKWMRDHPLRARLAMSMSQYMTGLSFAEAGIDRETARAMLESLGPQKAIGGFITDVRRTGDPDNPYEYDVMNAGWASPLSAVMPQGGESLRSRDAYDYVTNLLVSSSPLTQFVFIAFTKHDPRSGRRVVREHGTSLEKLGDLGAWALQTAVPPLLGTGGQDILRAAEGRPPVSGGDRRTLSQELKANLLGYKANTYTTRDAEAKLHKALYGLLASSESEATARAVERTGLTEAKLARLKDVANMGTPEESEQAIAIYREIQLDALGQMQDGLRAYLDIARRLPSSRLGSDILSAAELAVNVEPTAENAKVLRRHVGKIQRALVQSFSPLDTERLQNQLGTGDQ
jgi:hypothetical protein